MRPGLPWTPRGVAHPRRSVEPASIPGPGAANSRSNRPGAAINFDDLSRLGARGDVGLPDAVTEVLEDSIHEDACPDGRSSANGEGLLLPSDMLTNMRLPDV
jgi:hypothetical protein